MLNLTQRLKSHRFAMLAFSVALLGMLVGVGLGLTRNGQVQKKNAGTIAPPITSKTSAIRVVSAEPTSLGNASVLLVRLQNTSEQDIKAYSIANGKSWVTTSYLVSEKSFAPGTVVEEVLTLSHGASKDFRVPLTGSQFTVVAAYFSDGTGDGVSLFVSRIAEQHAGIRDQASRILPCLRGVSLSDSEKLVAACEAEALNLPVKVEGKTSDYESGLDEAKQEILSQLNDIKEKARSSQLPQTSGKQEKLIRIFEGLAAHTR